MDAGKGTKAKRATKNAFGPQRRNYRADAESLAKAHERTLENKYHTVRFLRAQAKGWRAIAVLACESPEEWKGRIPTVAAFVLSPFGGDLEKMEAFVDDLVVQAQASAIRTGIFPDTREAKPRG